MRVAVIGSGIVGSCVGWHLARRGADIVMIDAGMQGAGVTSCSFAWVNASNKTQSREYFDLNVAGISAHRELSKDLGPGDWWHPTGHLRWYDDPAGADMLRDAVGLLRGWGYDAEFWGVERVRRLLEPQVEFPNPDTEIAFFRDEGWIDGRALVARLIDEVVSNGGEAHCGRAVTGITTKGSRITEVVLNGGQRHAVDSVVNAAGPAGWEVAGFVGRTLPMRDEPGLVARVRCDRVPIRRAMHAPHVELRPDGPSQVALHSREIDDVIDPVSDTSDLAMRLHRLAIDVVPALGCCEVVGARVAWRPIPIDGFPSVGGVEQVDGYYEAVTHSGITLGAIVGRLLAQEIMDGTVNKLIEPYRPDRFVATRSS
jgi:glycine/D-amino acid oxidase-like deaminating enzyme